MLGSPPPFERVLPPQTLLSHEASQLAPSPTSPVLVANGHQDQRRRPLSNSDLFFVFFGWFLWPMVTTWSSTKTSILRPPTKQHRQTPATHIVGFFASKTEDMAVLESVEVEPSGLHPGQPKDECTHINLIGSDSVDYSRISINVYIYMYISTMYTGFLHVFVHLFINVYVCVSFLNVDTLNEWSFKVPLIGGIGSISSPHWQYISGI